MSPSIYFPDDLLRPITRYHNTSHLALGLRTGNATVVMTTITTAHHDRFGPTIPGLEIVAGINHKTEGLPVLTITTALAYPRVSSAGNFNVVLYTPPRPRSMEYYAIQPIFLTAKNRVRPAWYTHKLKLHCDLNPSASETLLPQVVHFINTCIPLRRHLAATYPRVAFSGDAMRFERATQGADRLVLVLRHALRTPLAPVVYGLVHLLGLVIAVLNHRVRVPAFYQPPAPRLTVVSTMGVKAAPQTQTVTVKHDGKVTLAEVSHLLGQLSRRLTQLYHLPEQYHHTKLSHPIDLTRLDQFDFQNLNYITFYNNVWLIFNDLTLGFSLGNLFALYESEIRVFVTQRLVREGLVYRLGNLIDWLMADPAGVKLNGELASFIGELFLWTLRFWQVLLDTVIISSLSLGLRALPFISTVGGLSFVVAAAMDLVRLVTFHIYCFQYSAARLYHWQITILRSLFKVITGKRINVLREGRTDKVDYSFDQRLLGTVLFMVLVYLVPTVVAFHVPFSIIRMVVRGLGWGSGRVVYWLNSFPLFVVLLKLKNTRRLPGGLRFELIEVDTHTRVFRMENQSVSLRDIFS